MIEIERCDAAGDATVFAFTWRPGDGDAIGGRLQSGSTGVELHFGPTVAVAHWPGWLRSITHFGGSGGEARIWLDPHREPAPDSASLPALNTRGNQARHALAALLQMISEAIRAGEADPSGEQRQAFETCAGVALALSSDHDGALPTPSEYPELFSPAPLSVTIDDRNSGPGRRHVRLTYRLPRLEGRLTDGCSLRFFREQGSFGLEFRSLDGDHLPVQLRPACIEDHFGPLLRFTIDRAGLGTRVEGNPDAAQAFRLVQAIARQACRDMIAFSASGWGTGFEGALWRHWLAALPDLLASPSAMPLDTAQAH